MNFNIDDLFRYFERGRGDAHDIPMVHSIDPVAADCDVVVYCRMGDFFAEMISDGRTREVACGLTEISALVSLREKLLLAYSSDSTAVKKVDDRMGQLLHLKPQ